MSASVRARHQDDVCIIELLGRLTIGEGDTLLREEVKNAVDEGYKRIVLDLRETVAMDSSGLGELIRAKGTVRQAGGQIVLAGVKNKVQDVLEMTRLIGIFEEYDSADDALMEIANLQTG